MIDRKIQNMDEIVLEPIDKGKVEVMIKSIYRTDRLIQRTICVF